MTPSYIDILNNHIPSRVKDLVYRNSFVLLFLKTITLVALFVVVEFFVMRISFLPAQSYNSPFLVFELLRRIGFLPSISLALLVVLLSKYGNLWSPWQALHQGQILRYFIVFLCFLMVWPLTTYGYNFYFAQGHYLDRALITLLLGLVWWRPVFIYPLVILLFTVLWQFKQPSIGGTVLAHKLQVLHVLNLFGAAFLIYAITGYRKSNGFIFVTCCLVASAYWLPAYAKLQLEWLNHGHLYRLPLAAYAHGWLSFLSPDQIVSFAKSIAWLDWPMRIAVIFVEAGCLFFLVRRSVSIALLIGVIIFHCGVFALYGFFFWTWILLDVGLLVILLKDYHSRRWNIYSGNYLLLSIMLIATCSYWANPPVLAWYDTRLTYTYKFEAIMANGDRKQIPAEFFAPYEDVFTMASFSYLAKDHSVLVGPYGVTKNTTIANTLMPPISATEVFALEQEHNERGYVPKRANSLYEFVSRYISNHNKTAANITDLRWLAPPRQFWSFEGNINNFSKEKITQVTVTEVTTLYNDRTLDVIREKVMKIIAIPE